jgi:glycosyltransferase involved in cell wall biosynthesis
LSDIDDPSITITGKVVSVLPYLCHANVAIVPLFFESGTRFKILEAGATGIPMVSTTLGAEGIPVINGKEILIADEPEEFAEAVIRIIENPDFAANLVNNCKALIEESYSVDALVNEANEILDFLFKEKAKSK